MNREWPSRAFRSRATWFAVAVALGVVYSAFVGANSTQEPAASSPAPASTQPAAEALPEGPPATARQWAREQLMSGLIGSRHDFTEGGKSGRDLCLPCHTPHLVAAPPPRFDRRATTVQPLRPYQAMGIELSGWSLLCLGCHDGVTAKDVYSSNHAISVTGQLGNSRLGSSGTRSHPVGVLYPKAAEDYNPPAAVEAAGMHLPDGRIQCTTCHDAHNTHRIHEMLRISNDRSRLCLTCHRI
jgi:predicted CXXCH cytochrome family protein